MEYPRVLVIGINAWRDEGSIHTLIDIFSHWQKDKVAHIYAKATPPNTAVCDRFFQISENEVLKSVFKPWKCVGHEVANAAQFSSEDIAQMEVEKKRYARARKKHSWLMTCCREAVWALGHWRSVGLKKFVADFKPDVVFIPIYPTVYMGWLQRHIIRQLSVPVVGYLMDDNYTCKACGWNLFAWIHRFFLRGQVKKLVELSERIFVIVDKQKEEYDQIFGIDSVILTKGIDYSALHFQERKAEPGAPLRMVYTGKLVIGRDQSLAAISRALKEINRDGVRIVMDIYSPDTVDEKTMTLLNSNGVTFRGCVPQSEIAWIQSEADIVVFCESLEKKFRQAARLSFSTKLTDYFKSGKCIFAIGDASIAPMDYLRRNDAAVIANDYESIFPQLQRLADHPELVDEYCRKSFECGKRNHDLPKVKAALIGTICGVCKKS